MDKLVPAIHNAADDASNSSTPKVQGVCAGMWVKWEGCPYCCRRTAFTQFELSLCSASQIRLHVWQTHVTCELLHVCWQRPYHAAAVMIHTAGPASPYSRHQSSTGPVVTQALPAPAQEHTTHPPSAPAVYIEHQLQMHGHKDALSH